MSRFGSGLLMGLLFGFIFAGIACIGIDANARKDEYKSRTLITECESTLPRNESCELIARKKGV